MIFEQVDPFGALIQDDVFECSDIDQQPAVYRFVIGKLFEQFKHTQPVVNLSMVKSEIYV